MPISEKIKKDINILVVDDEHSALELLFDILSKEGYNVELATNGDEAIARINKEQINIVVTDFKMSKMNGLEVITRIKEVDPLVSFIIITAYPSLEIAVRAMKKGVKDFIIKPFGADEIVDAVNKVVKEQISYRKKRIREKQESLLLIDEIAGVYNREYFFEALNQEISRIRRYKHDISLLLINIDGYNKFTQEQGFRYGNIAINEIGQFILENVREVDIVGRISREEFGVILLDAGEEKVLEIAERIKTLVESKKFRGNLEQQDYRFTVSIGTSSYQPEKDLLKDAQLSLKKAKRQERTIF